MMEKELREMHEKLDFILETLQSMSKTVAIRNVISPSMIGEYLQSPAGESGIMNRISRLCNKRLKENGEK